MTKIKQALAGYIKDNMVLYITVLILFLIGIILGIYAVLVLQQSQVAELKEYLDIYFYGLSDNATLNQTQIIGSSLVQNLKMLSILWLLGITMFGIPAAIGLLVLKGFTLGFTINFLFTEFSFGGLFFALSATIPQNIFIIPAFLTAGVASLSFSLLHIQSKIKKRRFHFWQNLWNYTALFIVLALFIVAGSFAEAYITPVFIRISLGIL